MTRLYLFRYYCDSNETLGLLYLNDKFIGYTLEDEKREVKLRGETRIPPGTYEIKFRKVLSPSTKKYRERYPWFTWHLELQNVPNFRFIYIHPGKTEQATDGCILIGNAVNFEYSRNSNLGRVDDAYEGLYKTLEMLLNAGATVQISIVDNIRGV
jgi:hypothetical protein